MSFAFAESLTGGKLSNEVVNIAGASKTFMGSIVAYSNDSKINILGVDKRTIEKETAVSEKVALQMAAGAKVQYKSSIALSTTGVAGPDKEDGKEVGLVYIAIVSDKTAKAIKYHFSGNREKIRQETVIKTLTLLKKYLLIIEKNKDKENEQVKQEK
jgi:nicotinamide-nucleotide amidase